jgi:transposase
VLGAYLGYLWCFARVFLRAPSGRQRFNVLGALNAVNHQLVTVTNDTYINAESVCELLKKLKKLELPTPITVVLDNSRYQRCRKVLESAASLGIELLFLPPYSPNLNLIERLWKFVKKECLYSKYYSAFADFKQAIETCLGETQGRHRHALDTLLTLKFQLFENLTL